MIEKICEALILSGGLGTRLRPVMSDAPKPMASINGRPFLEFLLDYWLEHGVERFILSVGYLAEQVIDHFGNEFKGATVEYVREEEPLGTGGALALAFRKITWRSRHIMLLNGDTWLTSSLDRLTEAAEIGGHPVILTLVQMADNNRYGGVEIEANGRINRFGLPAAGGPALINAGCYLLEQERVGQLLAGRPVRFSLEDDFLKSLAVQGLLGGLVEEAEFIDIGVPEDYHRFVRLFAPSSELP